MSTTSRYYPNLYKDSVSLMTVSAEIMSLKGIDAASIVMASATNIDNLREAGLADPSTITRNGVHGAAYLAQAADMAVALAKGEEPGSEGVTVRSGTGDQWFQAPANPVDGLYFPGYSVEDAAADLGDSAITETNGLGGFAMAASPAIAALAAALPRETGGGS